MSLTQMFLSEFDFETAATRKTLDRVADDKLDWKPHAKSFSMGNLATHIANIPNWATFTFAKDSLDLAPPGGPPLPQPAPVKSRQELLETFDRSVASARESLAKVTEEQFSQPWSLLRGGNVLLTMPRKDVLRRFVLNHIVHHRAQLGVYLRLNDIPVPSTYGPSADEAM